jgi:hypothetical protein
MRGRGPRHYRSFRSFIYAIVLLGLVAAVATMAAGNNRERLRGADPAAEPAGVDGARASKASPRRMYWGAWIGSHLTGTEAPWDPKAMGAFEHSAHKRLSLLQFSTPFLDCRSECAWVYFPKPQFDAVRAHGAIPFFSWASASIPVTPRQPAFMLKEIAAGTFDVHIRRWAESARRWRHPFFLRFNWEMNATDFPWSYRANGNSARSYVAAWRHVHDVFRRAGARNVTWVWCPNADPAQNPRTLSSAYPGDAYVDWTCVDVYNFGSPWRSFGRVAGPYYREITGRIAPTKPMVIAETAAPEKGGSKATWITSMLKAIPRMPKIRGVMYFDTYTGGYDWPIESSPAAQAAFSRGIAARHYVGNDFARLRSSPIPPP